MDENQKINCTVESCKYNNYDGRCTLKEIKVTPTDDTYTEESDESMCSSYEYDE